MDPFTQSFLIALLFSSCDDNGDSLANHFTVDDLTEYTVRTLAAQCLAFQTKNQDLLQDLDPEQCGHDFAKVRNHEVAEFWSHGLGDKGKALTRACNAYGEVALNAFEDTDGKIKLTL